MTPKGEVTKERHLKLDFMKVKNFVHQKTVFRWEVGRRFMREGTYDYPRLIHADVWQKPTQHGKQ